MTHMFVKQTTNKQTNHQTSKQTKIKTSSNKYACYVLSSKPQFTFLYLPGNFENQHCVMLIFK